MTDTGPVKCLGPHPPTLFRYIFVCVCPQACGIKVLDKPARLCRTGRSSNAPWQLANEGVWLRSNNMASQLMTEIKPLPQPQPLRLEPRQACRLTDEASPTI